MDKVAISLRAATNHEAPVYAYAAAQAQRSTNGSAPAKANSSLCLERASKLDDCLIKLVVYGDRSFVPPRTEKQLDEHCSSLDDNVKCVSSYSRECLPAFARNIYSVLLRRLKGQFAKRCKAPEGRKGELRSRLRNTRS